MAALHNSDQMGDLDNLPKFRPDWSSYPGPDEPDVMNGSLTISQKTNLSGFPKPSELIEITGAHQLEATDRAIQNMLFQHAHDSGRMTDRFRMGDDIRPNSADTLCTRKQRQSSS